MTTTITPPEEEIDMPTELGVLPNFIDGERVVPGDSRSPATART
jgi:hypothetical protein